MPYAQMKALFNTPKETIKMELQPRQKSHRRNKSILKQAENPLEESSKPEDSSTTTQKLEDTEQKDATAEAKPPPKELPTNAEQDKTSQYTNRDTPKGMAMYTQQVVTFGYASSNWQ